ncbi:MAG: enoyl-CoA hydratase [Rhodospirillaceae bacterium]|nr:enoyl-CoA hydratase [Rhodospirillaceae bacterium]
MTGNEPLVLRRDDGGVRTLTLNRPGARNALSEGMIAALTAELAEIARTPAVRVVVLAAAGPAFCAGHDLKELRTKNDPAWTLALFEACSDLMLAITRLAQPVIARVHGIATAAGCQLVATADLAVAVSTATFATPGVNIGLFCSTPMVALSRNIGRKPAMEMLLTGRPISADEALRLGLVNRVVSAEALDGAVAELANAILAKSPRVLSIGKRAFYEQADKPLAEAYAYTSAVMAKNMLEPDAHEGIDAFLAKRAPVWRGETIVTDP